MTEDALGKFRKIIKERTGAGPGEAKPKTPPPPPPVLVVDTHGAAPEEAPANPPKLGTDRTAGAGVEFVFRDGLFFKIPYTEYVGVAGATKYDLRILKVIFRDAEFEVRGRSLQAHKTGIDRRNDITITESDQEREPFEDEPPFVQSIKITPRRSAESVRELMTGEGKFKVS